MWRSGGFLTVGRGRYLVVIDTRLATGSETARVRAAVELALKRELPDE